MSEHLLAVTVSSTLSNLVEHMESVNYSVIFGAFAGAVFYVTGAKEQRRIVSVAYFIVSMLVGIYGAGLAGNKLAQLLGYSDKPLDSLGAVLLSALAIKALTFISQQNPARWLARIKGELRGQG